MPATDFATNIALPDSQILDPENEDSQIECAQQGAFRGASKPLRGLLFGFTATVAVGLGLASWYVGARIVATNEAAPSTTAASAPVNALPTPIAAVSPPQVHENSRADAVLYAVPPADLYLQVDGLGLKQDADFASSLQAKGFPAQVQMRDGSTTRILIGPFSTHVELEQVQRKLRSTGVLAIETTY